MATVVSSTALPADVGSLLGPGVTYVAPEQGSWPRPELLAQLERLQPEGLIVSLTERVDEPVLDASSALRVVGNFAVGYDNVDLPAATSRSILVANTPDVLTDATADLTFALLLGVARRLREGHEVVVDGEWAGFAPDLLLGAAVGGATLGIIGLGRIGRAVARRARGFGMDILYSGRRVEAAPLLGAQHASEEVLFQRSDFVTLHCPLTDATENIVDVGSLSLMKKSAFLINTARGRCVNEAALASALEAGEIAGAALDVFADEPAVHNGLVGLRQVLLAPHVGSATRAARRKMSELCASAVSQVLAGNRPANALNPEVMV